MTSRTGQETVLLQLCALVAPDNVERSQRENPNENVALKVPCHGRKRRRRLGVGVCGARIAFLGIAPLCLFPTEGHFRSCVWNVGKDFSEED